MDRKRHQTCLHLKAVGKASPLLAEFAHPRTRHPFVHHDAYSSNFPRIILSGHSRYQGISLSDKHKIRIQSILLLQSFLTHLLLQPWNSWGRFFYQALGSLSTALRQSGFTIEYKETSQARKCLDAFAFRFYFVKSLLPFVNAAFILKSMLLYLFL